MFGEATCFKLLHTAALPGIVNIVCETNDDTLPLPQLVNLFHISIPARLHPAPSLIFATEASDCLFSALRIEVV